MRSSPMTTMIFAAAQIANQLHDQNSRIELMAKKNLGDLEKDAAGL